MGVLAAHGGRGRPGEVRCLLLLRRRTRRESHGLRPARTRERRCAAGAGVAREVDARCARRMWRHEGGYGWFALSWFNQQDIADQARVTLGQPARRARRSPSVFQDSTVNFRKYLSWLMRAIRWRSCRSYYDAREGVDDGGREGRRTGASGARRAGARLAADRVPRRAGAWSELRCLRRTARQPGKRRDGGCRARGHGSLKRMRDGTRGTLAARREAEHEARRGRAQIERRRLRSRLVPTSTKISTKPISAQPGSRMPRIGG